MKTKALREAADAAEAQQAIQARRSASTPPVSEADLAEVMEVGAVDDYVAETGEYPMSGDLAEGELAEEGFFEDLVGPDAALGALEGGAPVPVKGRKVPPGGSDSGEMPSQLQAVFSRCDALLGRD
jgi:hypothetical protein